MEIVCCACGEPLPYKVKEAIANEEWSRQEAAPIVGVVCNKCEEKLDA